MRKRFIGGSIYHSPMPEFPRRDPADPEFWNLRYQASFAPWDAGKVPAQLAAFARRERGRVLVPGCGSAWDVRRFAGAGWDVDGIDFSADAVAAARRSLILSPLGAPPRPLADRVRQADFFAPIPEAPFDLVYERAFLCALPRRLWPAWSARVAELVKPGGKLAGFFFIDTNDRGPPFPLHRDGELVALLEPAFARLEDEPVPDSIAVFEGKERWQVWQRKIGSG